MSGDASDGLGDWVLAGDACAPHRANGGMRMLLTLLSWLLVMLAPWILSAEELPWTPVPMPGFKMLESWGINLDLQFQGDFGWLNTGKQLWITHDAGRSWTLSLTPPESRLFYDSYFISALEGWAVANVFPNSLFYTKDG